LVPKRLLTLAFVTLSLAPASAFAGNGRTTFRGGGVITSNPDHLWAEGVVVEGRVIIAIATTGEVLRFKEDDSKLVDLKGKTMIALPIEHAVIAYKPTSAEAEFQEHGKGALEAGKLADIVVLSQDIFALPPPAILKTQLS
jgi:predicted amidohydrolase YtcJ